MIKPSRSEPIPDAGEANLFTPPHEVEDAEDRVSEVLPHLASGLVILGADQRISSWNSQAERITGYTFQQVNTLSLAQLFEPAEIMQHILRKAQEDIPTLSEYLHLRRVDGTQVPVSVQCSPQRHMGRTECQMVVAFRELEPLEEQLRRNDHLMMLGRLASSLSHEIRNPLNAIFLHADVMEEELHQPSSDNLELVLESLTEIKREITRVDDLVQDYLSLARLSTLEREPEILGAVVEEFALEMAAQMAERNVSIELEGLGQLGPVALHRNTFRRVLLNLVQNAMDAMPQGGTVTFRGRRQASQLYLDVQDTGTGIPNDQLPLLFTPFHSTKAEGTGLGLHVVQEIIAAHEGRIMVASEPGTGAVFTISLPLVEPDASPIE
jgi:PAS domain S-box-containing protein